MGAAALFAVPLTRAVGAAREVDESVAFLFSSRPPRTLGDARPRPSALAASDLLWVAPDGGAPSRHVYRTAGGRPLSLDLYRRADAPSPRPVVVAIHGGSWRSGDLAQLPQAYAYLARRGYAVAAIEYRLAPRDRFPAALEDVKAAIAWVKAQAGALGLDASRIALYGRSAGGHLALLAAYTAADPAVRGVVALYAPTDLLWSWHNPSDPKVLDTPLVLTTFLGGTPAEVPHLYDAASPLRFVSRRSPPTLLVHGARDELVSLEQSRRLARRLAEEEVPHLLVELPWATHGCEAVLGSPSGQITLYAVERFLAHVL